MFSAIFAVVLTANAAGSATTTALSHSQARVYRPVAVPVESKPEARKQAPRETLTYTAEVGQ